MATSRTRSQYRSGILTFYDDQQNHEVVQAMAPVHLRDDFLGDSIDPRWGAITVGTPTAAALLGTGTTTDANGRVGVGLAATSEAETHAFCFNDILPFNLTLGLVAEFVFGFSTLPTTTSVAVVGVSSIWTSLVPDTVATSAWFRANSSGAILVGTDDGTTDTAEVATGTTLTANQMMVGRIDFSTLASVKFFINGVRVASGTTFNMAAAAVATTAKVQPCATVYRAAVATNLAMIALDQVELHQRRS